MSRLKTVETTTCRYLSLDEVFLLEIPLTGTFFKITFLVTTHTFTFPKIKKEYT